MKTMQNPAGFRTVFTGSTGINLKQQNRTDHLLQKPDIFICYRQKETPRVQRGRGLLKQMRATRRKILAWR
jgi:hypothetical protein